jgi:hypothetical protein
VYYLNFCDTWMESMAVLERFRAKAILVGVYCDENCIATECFDLIDKESVKMVFISTECVCQANGL